MIAFIDDHCDAYGVEAICRLLPIVPITERIDEEPAFDKRFSAGG